MPPEMLLEALAKTVRTDLLAALARIDSATPDLEARARLTHAAAGFMFGAACGALKNLHPEVHLQTIGEHTAVEMVDNYIEAMRGLPKAAG